MIQSLLDRSDAARILAVNHVADFVRQMESFFVYDLRIFYNIYGNIMINKTEDVQIHKVDRTLNFHDIFLSHFITLCIFYDCNAAVQFIQMQVFIDIHASPCLDMIQNKSFFNTSDS